MVVRRLGVEADPDDERDALGEPSKTNCLPDRLAVQRPARQLSPACSA